MLAGQPAPAGALSAIKPHPQLLVQVGVDLSALWNALHGAAHHVQVTLDPSGFIARLDEIGQFFEINAAAGTFADLDLVTHFEQGRRYVGPAAIHGEVAMAHQLARLGATAGKAQPVNDIVHTGFEHLEHGEAGETARLESFAEIAAELGLKDAIHAASLLLGPQLLAKIGFAGAGREEEGGGG